MSREMTIGIVSAIGAAALAAFAVLGGSESNPDQVRTLPYVIGFTLVMASIVFGLVVAWAERRSQALRTNRPAKVGLVASILGLLTVLAFWSGLPVIFGGAGVALGMVGQARAAEAGRRRLAMAAIIVGALAMLLAVGITIMDSAL
jgi:hypothetical protein